MEKKQTKGFPLGKTILAVCSFVLMAVFIVGWVVSSYYTKVINLALDLKSTKTVMLPEDADKEPLFKSDYEEIDDLKKSDMEVAERLTEEGSVLLKNENNALPLKNDASVTILGHSSTNMLVCGTGSADISAILDLKKYHSKLSSIDGYLNLKAALEERTKIKVNKPVWNAYMSWTESRKYPTNPEKGDNSIRGGDGSVVGSYTVNEPSWSELNKQKDVSSSFANYKDAAIVVISRLGGEMYDLPVNTSVKGNANETVNGSGNSLELTVNELDLIHQAKQNFDKVIVLINSANPLECDFLTKSDSEVDAALWVGYTGVVGLYGVADLLVGKATPSGRLVDTYCNDNTTSPAMQNFYGGVWTNAGALGAKYDATTGRYTAGGLMVGSDRSGNLDGNMNYNVYQEGIYVGYRYYETRYEDVVLGTANTGAYNYLADVAYPFGYGLSYTTFEYSDVKFEKTSGGYDVSVTVTNTGEYAGKEVVEVYLQSEYTDFDKTNKIEKSAVELCGFAKTKLLKKGESETVKISVSDKEFRTYFAGKNGGEGGYILDAGTYYLSVGTDAHDALNNILDAKGKTGMVVAGHKTTSKGNKELTTSWKVDSVDNDKYAKSEVTGNKIVNQLQEAELSSYDGTQSVEYLSRGNWTGTFPTAMKQIELTKAMQNEMTGIKQYSVVTVAGETKPTLNAKNGVVLSELTGKAYDDPLWDKLLDQLSYQDMAHLIGLGYHGTVYLESISKPQTADENGPQGFSAKLTSITGKDVTLCAYTDENIMAATWNVELMEEVGEHIGEDGLWSGYSGLYGPAMNTHRTPYAGRNFEYYSEDGFLGGKIAAAEVKGIQKKGVYVFVKHFAFNDSETGCRSISTFGNEQALREVYLEPFEKAIVEGGAYNVMNAFARVGVVWSGAHGGLMTNILRGEWGMRGFAVSDYTNTSYATTAHNRGTYDALLGVINGTDTFDSSAATTQENQLLTYKGWDTDVHLLNCMREASKRICYVVANSNAMNERGTVVGIMNWWQFTIIDGIIFSAIWFVISVAMLVLEILKQKKLSGNIVSDKNA